MNVMRWLKGLFTGRPAETASPFPSGTGPARIIVFRHAEKTGEKSDPHLSAAGQKRADRLASYVPKTFGKPDFLIAASRNKYSDRPLDTLIPLARSLGLEITNSIQDEDTDGLVSLLRDTAVYAGKFGLVCWRHSDLPDVCAALGAPEGAFPAEWGEDVYDLMIEITYAGGAPAARSITMPF